MDLLDKLFQSVLREASRAGSDMEGVRSGRTVQKGAFFRKTVKIEFGRSEMMGGTADPAVLQELANSLGIPVDDLQKLTNAEGVQQDGELSAREQDAAGQTRAVESVGAQEAVTCAKCQARTAGRTTCQWCGAQLTMAAPAANAVDQKFLNQDVHTEPVVRERQPLKQSFLQRLKGIDPEQQG